MALLDEVEWGDVVHDGDGVLVCEGLLDGDAVLVKRWQQGVLDDELAARLLLAGAGVATVELLGHGPGWMVLESLGESMWRPAGHDDLDDPASVRALARWYVACHHILPAGMGAGGALGLTPELAQLAASGLPGPTFSALSVSIARWEAALAASPRVLAVGPLAPGGWAVMGAGIHAMVTDLSLCHGGTREEDLAAVCARLPASMRSCFLDEYARQAQDAGEGGESHAGAAGPAFDPDALAAAEAMSVALPVVLRAIASQEPDAAQLSALDALLEL